MVNPVQAGCVGEHNWGNSGTSCGTSMASVNHLWSPPTDRNHGSLSQRHVSMGDLCPKALHCCRQFSPSQILSSSAWWSPLIKQGWATGSLWSLQKLLMVPFQHRSCKCEDSFHCGQTQMYCDSVCVCVESCGIVIFDHV